MTSFFSSAYLFSPNKVIVKLGVKLLDHLKAKNLRSFSDWNLIQDLIKSVSLFVNAVEKSSQSNLELSSMLLSFLKSLVELLEHIHFDFVNINTCLHAFEILALVSKKLDSDVCFKILNILKFFDLNQIDDRIVQNAGFSSRIK